MGPYRFLMPLTSRKAWCRSPSMYITVSTMCSSTLGPAMSPALQTSPHISRTSTMSIQVVLHDSSCLQTPLATALSGVILYMLHSERGDLSRAEMQRLKGSGPVFVTCPTRNTGTPWRFATCSRAVAHSLTCMRCDSPCTRVLCNCTLAPRH